MLLLLSPEQLDLSGVAWLVTLIAKVITILLLLMILVKMKKNQTMPTRK
jgi:hypothetical protein